jgi:hypothetical protein
MKWFQRKKEKQAICANCTFQATAMDQNYCAKDLPSHVDVRYLSAAGVQRNCSPLPKERTCSEFQLAVR